MALLESIPNHFAGGLPSGQRRLASLGDLGERPKEQIIPSLVSELGHWQAVAAALRGFCFYKLYDCCMHRCLRLLEINLLDEAIQRAVLVLRHLIT